MALRLHHASLRELRAMQESRRKYGAGDLNESDDANPQEAPEPSAENPADAGNEASAQGESSAAEIRAQAKPTVPQVADEDARCNDAPAESELIREPGPQGGLAQTLAKAEALLRRTGFEPLIE
jgi:hypothetical protein